MFRAQHDLSNMRGVMRDLAVNGLQNSVSFAANGDGAHHIFSLQGIDCLEDARPATFPPCHNFCASRRGSHFKLAVTEAIRFLAVAGEEIGKTRPHIAREVLHEDCDRIRLGIKRDEKIFIAKLCKRGFAHVLVSAELAACFLEVMRRCISHGWGPPANFFTKSVASARLEPWSLRAM